MTSNTAVSNFYLALSEVMSERVCQGIYDEESTGTGKIKRKEGENGERPTGKEKRKKKYNRKTLSRQYCHANYLGLNGGDVS